MYVHTYACIMPTKSFKATDMALEMCERHKIGICKIVIR
jgi:hypothetical protein